MSPTKARLLRNQLADEARVEGKIDLAEAVGKALPSSYVSGELLILRYGVGPKAVRWRKEVEHHRVLLAELLCGITDPDAGLFGVHTERVE